MNQMNMSNQMGAVEQGTGTSLQGTGAAQRAAQPPIALGDAQFAAQQQSALGAAQPAAQLPRLGLPRQATDDKTGRSLTRQGSDASQVSSVAAASVGSGNYVDMTPDERVAALRRAIVEYRWFPRITLDAITPDNNSVIGRASILGVACLCRIEIRHCHLQAPDDAFGTFQPAVDQAAVPRLRSRSPVPRSPGSTAASASGPSGGQTLGDSN